MPSLVVFDLDLTLWHCGPLLWCDQLQPPIHQDADGTIHDANEVKISLYHEVPKILKKLTEDGYTLALASRTSAPHIAHQLLELFEIAHYFSYQEIYPSDKTVHFAALKEQTGIRYQEMIFFDDEPRNISDVTGIGAQAHLVTHGITHDLIRETLLDR